MIRFPKMHIAASVSNRILNIADEIDEKDRSEELAAVREAPMVPDPTLQGAGLDLAFSEGTSPALPPDDPTQAAMAAESVTGGSASNAVIASALS